MANYNAILNVNVTSIAATESVSLADVKLYCKIDELITLDDFLLSEMITVARQVVEDYTNEALTPRNITAIVRNLCGEVYLPYSPITSAVILSDSDGNSISDGVVLGDDRAFIKEPITDYIKATYTAGYTAANLPKKYATAIKMQVAYMYENRGDLKVAPMVKTLLSSARKM
jgi:uncharacterized phiE125 gp8 family phage protein